MTKPIMQRQATVSGAQAAGLIAVLAISACSGGQRPSNSSLIGHLLAPCPDSPNCVSSQASVESQRVDPLRYSGDAAAAQLRLLSVLKAMKRATVVHADAVSIQAEFRSALFGFVDDVTFYFDPPGVIQVRSASRVGYSDLGVNRERVAEIRLRFSSNSLE